MHMCMFEDFIYLIRTNCDQETTGIFFLLHPFLLFSSLLCHSTISWLTGPQMSYALQNQNYTGAIFHPGELFKGKEP